MTITNEELRRLCDSDIALGPTWPTHDEFIEDGFREATCAYLAAASPFKVKAMLDQIDTLISALQTAKHALFRDGATQELEEVFAALESVGVKP